MGRVCVGFVPPSSQPRASPVKTELAFFRQLLGAKAAPAGTASVQTGREGMRV